MFESDVNGVETQSREYYGDVNSSVLGVIIMKMTSVTRTPGIEAELMKCWRFLKVQ